MNLNPRGYKIISSGTTRSYIQYFLNVSAALRSVLAGVWILHSNTGDTYNRSLLHVCFPPRQWRLPAQTPKASARNSLNLPLVPINWESNCNEQKALVWYGYIYYNRVGFFIKILIDNTSLETVPFNLFQGFPGKCHLY